MDGETAHAWIRSNVLGLVAIFIALGGTAVAAQVAGDPEAQPAAKKKKKKAKAGPVGPQGPSGAQGQAGPQGAQGPPGPPIAFDAIGPGEIQDITRSVNLPLGSFVNVTDGTGLNFTASDGLTPDFELDDGGGLVITWDDDSDGAGANVGDTDFVASTFTVPQDFASGGTFGLRGSKPTHTTGVGERFACVVIINGDGPGGVGGANLGNAANASYSVPVPPPEPYSAGASVSLRCQASDIPGGSTFDDPVRLHSVEFRYTATQ